MEKAQKTFIVLFAALFLLSSVCTPAIGEANKTSSKEDDSLILIDMAVARPIGMATIVAGTALFVIWLPFSLPSGNVKDSWNKLVVKPVKYTFKRPLGEL